MQQERSLCRWRRSVMITSMGAGFNTSELSSHDLRDAPVSDPLATRLNSARMPGS
jgi:hypothetical protein